MVCGNGGSAADAQHFSAELTCTFFHKNRKGLPCLALTCNTSSLTAWANDFDYSTVFARQVEAYGKKGDILFSITTSGNSKNILEAMNIAKKIGIKNILLTGKDGGLAIKQEPDIAIVVPSNETPRIQECHIFIIHYICDRVDEAFKDAQSMVRKV
jgi:D-sedoheptulose 7-phosphate isomerase